MLFSILCNYLENVSLIVVVKHLKILDENSGVYCYVPTFMKRNLT